MEKRDQHRRVKGKMHWFRPCIIGMEGFEGSRGEARWLLQSSGRIPRLCMRWGLIPQWLYLRRETVAASISPLFTTTHTSISLASHLHLPSPSAPHNDGLQDDTLPPWCHCLPILPIRHRCPQQLLQEQQHEGLHHRALRHFPSELPIPFSPRALNVSFRGLKCDGSACFARNVAIIEVLAHLLKHIVPVLLVGPLRHEHLLRAASAPFLPYATKAGSGIQVFG
jgi:hypothetical protein